MNFLIVDDDTDDREMFCEALEMAAPGNACYQAANGRKAFTALENGEMPIPDLIFLDINMPVMNGWQLLLKLKQTEAYKSIPVIMYSTSSHQEDMEKAQQLGALCFFIKPFSFMQLKQSLALVAHHAGNGTLASLVHQEPLFITGCFE